MGSILNYNCEELSFDKMATEAVADLARKRGSSTPFTNLAHLHQHFGPEDLPAVFSALYEVYMSEEFQRKYDILCSNIITDHLDGKASYQRVPSARIQMPGARSVNFHTDQWYGHGANIRNFWLPLVRVEGKNSMYVADDDTSWKLSETILAERLLIPEVNKLCEDQCEPLAMDVGEVYMFNARTMHGTVVSDTHTSRVSFDFRMVCDGDDRGLKDESFFVRPGQKAKPKSSREMCAVYVGKHRGFTNVLSQKYQTLICYRYAEEQKQSVLVGETELSGFDYQPQLWNILTGTWSGQYQHLILFSRLLLPESQAEQDRFFAEASRRNVTIHFVAEDAVHPPEAYKAATTRSDELSPA